MYRAAQTTKTRRLFGTDGIRGVANTEPMTAELAMQVGRAVAHIVRNGSHRHKIVVGKDTRLSGYMLENALAAGICSMGVDVYLVGPLSTPGIAFVTQSMRADAGAVISASHNPFQDNGIKFFARDGFKLPDEVELQIESLIFENRLDSFRPTAMHVGRATRIDDAQGRYIVFAKSTFPRELSLEGLKVVVDCANGAAYKVAPLVFEELGAEVIRLNVAPNGTNINDGCGALHPESMAKAVLEHGARLGIALDGDADRVIVVDEKGETVDGDAIMAICAQHLALQKKLAHDTVVATIMSNMGLDIAMARLGLRVERTQVGDRYVVEHMRRNGFNFGGEQSGHLIFLDHTTTGDGVIAALELLTVMLRSGKPLSELKRLFEPVPQTQVNLAIARKRDLADLPEVTRAIRDAENKLGKEGRVLVRFSGTELKARVLIEGPNRDTNETLAEQIVEALRAALC
ncbi:MAG: phosphoglucosamine mutase [Myxococcaceae bacterium]|nr:phosphoglucosamine mutase [Myxococcaceae bacterium]